MADHYDDEREAELEKLKKAKRCADLEERIARGRKPKISIKGEIVFLLSLDFIVGSLIILY